MDSFDISKLIQETYKLDSGNYTHFEDYQADFEMRMEYAMKLMAALKETEEVTDESEESDAESRNTEEDYSDDESVCGQDNS